jgi:hypothetical protein
MVQGERICTPTAHRRAVYSRLGSLVPSPWIVLVWMAGLEPAAPGFQNRYSARLSYTQMVIGADCEGRTRLGRVEAC